MTYDLSTHLRCLKTKINNIGAYREHSITFPSFHKISYNSSWISWAHPTISITVQLHLYPKVSISWFPRRPPNARRRQTGYYYYCSVVYTYTGHVLRIYWRTSDWFPERGWNNNNLESRRWSSSSSNFPKGKGEMVRISRTLLLVVDVDTFGIGNGNSLESLNLNFALSRCFR